MSKESVGDMKKEIKDLRDELKEISGRIDDRKKEKHSTGSEHGGHKEHGKESHGHEHAKTQAEVIADLKKSIEKGLKEGKEVSGDFKKDIEAILNIELKPFNLKTEDLGKIPGYNDLSVEQKFLLISNLDKVFAGEVGEEAIKRYQLGQEKIDINEYKGASETIGEKVSRAIHYLGQNLKPKNLPAQIYNGGRGLFKKWIIGSNEKKIANEYRANKFEKNAEAISKLVKGIKQFSPPVVYEKGEAKINWGATLDKSVDSRTMEAWNTASENLSKIPYAWSSIHAKPSDRKKYLEARAKFDAVRKDLIASGGDESSKKARMVAAQKTFSQIEVQQFLSTPENAETFKAIAERSNLSIVLKGLKQTSVDSGTLYFAGGLAGRIAIKSAAFASAIPTFGLSFVAIPAFAGIIGFLRGRTRAKETLRERDYLARRGIKDQTKEASNFVQSELMTAKIMQFVNKLEKGNLENRGEIINRLNRRVDYVLKKLDDGTVSFGQNVGINMTEDGKMKLSKISNNDNLDVRIGNQYALMIAINKALGWKAVGNKTDFDKRIEDKLKVVLENSKEKISESQRTYIRARMAQGAALGVTASIAGALVYDVYDAMQDVGDGGTEDTRPLPEPEKVIPPKNQFQGELNPDAIVRKGEGITHVLLRQLKNQPALMEEMQTVYGTKDPIDLVVKIAKTHGYIDGNGNEVRVLDATGNTAYQIGMHDGQSVINEMHDKIWTEASKGNRAFEDIPSQDVYEKEYEYIHHKGDKGPILEEGGEHEINGEKHDTIVPNKEPEIYHAEDPEGEYGSQTPEETQGEGRGRPIVQEKNIQEKSGYSFTPYPENDPRNPRFRMEQNEVGDSANNTPEVSEIAKSAAKVRYHMMIEKVFSLHQGDITVPGHLNPVWWGIKSRDADQFFSSLNNGYTYSTHALPPSPLWGQIEVQKRVFNQVCYNVYSASHLQPFDGENISDYLKRALPVALTNDPSLVVWLETYFPG